ncbi:MAG: EAL domain-containing protein [Spirochaetes bacterium]|nr:EAL domain-containing protein [Spirochaetota bacterium]
MSPAVKNELIDEVREAGGFSNLVGVAPFAVLYLNRDGMIIYANQNSWLLLAHWKCQVGEFVPREWIDHVNEALEHRELFEVEEHIGIKSIQIYIVPSNDAHTVYLYGMDITSRKMADQKLLLSSQVFDNVVEAVMIIDSDGRIVDVNSAFCNITGYSREEILGENFTILNSGRHDTEFYRQMWDAVTKHGNWQGELWDRRKNGEIYPKWMSISAVPNGGNSPTRYVCLFSDISTLKQTQEQLYNMAHYDSLTGLPNRRNFQDRLELTLEHAHRSGETVAVMFMDLDDFKIINDHLGHGAGDALLREVADRLRQSVRETDTVARMGGDEFTAILPGIDDSRNALQVAQKILSRISEPLMVAHRELNITASIGIAVYPDDADNADTLLQNADVALYRSKELGKNSHQFFSREMNTQAMKRLAMQSKLRQAIQMKEFLVYYQPQIDIISGKLTGLEALARWQDPEGPVVCAAEFIEIAEDTGLIVDIGRQIIREACRQGKSWLDSGLPPLRIAINISALQLRQPDFLDTITAIVHETGFLMEYIELELTESMLVDASRDTLHKLEWLKSAKASITIDDFGTKYSSLSYLAKLPIDRIKIDQSFIRELASDERCLAIATAIVAMGKSLKFEVIAEGVETEAQVRLLRACGCRYIQGHFCSVAAAADQMQSILVDGRCDNIYRLGE